VNREESKMMLSQDAMEKAQPALPAAVDQLLNPEQPRANVIGVAVGVKWTGGQPTGEAAILALVTQKVSAELLSSSDLVPSNVGELKTDVLTVGYLTAGAPLIAAPTMTMPELQPSVTRRYFPPDERVRERITEVLAAAPAPPVIEVLTHRIRPAKGGYSVGHIAITAGTIATCVYDILPAGIGVPPKFYILSNNHVLANSNSASFGDPILQPGPFDGGHFPEDLIARLSRFIPITFEPPVPRSLHRNLVDCAVAEGAFQDLDREIYWTGPTRGWRLRNKVLGMVGQSVKKTGRTTNISFGRITAVNATVDVNYGGGRLARFTDQIVTTAMSAGGDSGSLLLTPDNVAVGLLFAGSSIATIFNQIETVRSLLRVEVAEQIL